MNLLELNLRSTETDFNYTANSLVKLRTDCNNNNYNNNNNNNKFPEQNTQDNQQVSILDLVLTLETFKLNSV